MVRRRKVFQTAGVLMALAVMAASSGCRRRRPPPPAPVPVVPAVQPTEDEPEETPDLPTPDDLQPGPLVAFGLPIPLGASMRFEGPGLKMFDVPASTPRVMRFFERRITVRSAEVAALGAMWRSARLRQDAGQRVFDVGVRDENGHTLLSVWDRTPPPPAPPPPPGSSQRPQVAF